MRVIVPVCILLIFCMQVSADTITVGVATTGNKFPFGGTVGGYSGTRYQQAYDSSSFAALGPMSITGINFFLYSGSTLAPSTYDVYLSTITAGINALSNTLFDDNLGPDNTLFISAALSGAAPSTLSFNGTPFYYDPSAGNLLLDIIVSPGDVTGYSTFYQSTQSSSEFSRYHNFGTETIGWGLVTQFEYTTAVPEPVPAFLMGAGLMLLGIIRYRRR